MIHLVTYGDGNMSRAAERCEETARQHDVSAVWRWTEQELQATTFFRDNQPLLSQPRGAGYWVWKPFLILDTLLRRCGEGDVLIYADAGVEIVNDVRHVADRMDQDVFLFGNNYDHVHWCKGDALYELWRALRESEDLEVPPTGHVATEDELKMLWLRFGKQCQASVILFRATEFSRRFAREWLSWCLFEGGRLVDDSPSRVPNHPEFREHRHDQAILTTLAYREGLRLHWWPAMYNDGAFTYDKGVFTDDYPVLFHHHRKRNSEW